MSREKISVVGLGKLGACLAACLARQGFCVVGVDCDPETVDQVNQGVAPVREPGLDALLREEKSHITATQDIARAVHETTTTFIVVPTPSDSEGGFSTRFTRETARGIGQALRDKDDYHLVVLVSTVLPGGTEESVISVIEQGSGKRCRADFGVCYNPEFIALGNVIEGMLRPELVLIGESDARAGDELERLYGALVESKPVIVRTTFANAELAKISINTYVTMKITFANVLAEMCESLPGGNVDVVSKALGADSRIGPRYLKGGLGFGGPCFPRDTVAFATLARRLSVATDLPMATHAYNRSVATRIVERAQKWLPPQGSVSVVGMAYKPDTPVVEESQGLEIAQRLAEAGASVRVYDPVALETARRVLGERVGYAASLAEAIEGADLVILANPLCELKGLPPLLANNSHGRVVVIDCWRCLPDLAGETGIEYIGVGLEQAGAAREAAASPELRHSLR